MKPIELPYTKGNSKVPFYIVNFESAQMCTSSALGLCQHPDICYARKAETQYPNVRKFRKEQWLFWHLGGISPQPFFETAADYLEEVRQRSRVPHNQHKILRFSEAGDFDELTIVRFAIFAKRLIVNHAWEVFGYTARTDLMPAIHMLRSVGVVVNLQVENKDGFNHFKVVDEFSKGAQIKRCVGDCSICAHCRRDVGQTIQVIKH